MATTLTAGLVFDPVTSHALFAVSPVSYVAEPSSVCSTQALVGAALEFPAHAFQRVKTHWVFASESALVRSAAWRTVWAGSKAVMESLEVAVDLAAQSVHVLLHAQDFQSLRSGWNQSVDQAQERFYRRHDTMLVGRDTETTEVVPASELDGQRRQFSRTYIEPYRKWMPILPASLSFGVVYFSKGIVSIAAAMLMQSPVDWQALTLGDVTAHAAIPESYSSFRAKYRNFGL